jgi:DNA-binding MarR family transcriptional regulator
MTPRRENEPSKDLATEIWLRMSEMVLARDRRTLVTDAVGISFSRARVLRRVSKRPLPMSRLAATLGMDPSNATVLVNSLEKEGLVERHPDPNDRRARLVQTTRKGKAIAEKAEAILYTPPQALASASRADLKELARILDDIAGREASREEGK